MLFDRWLWRHCQWKVLNNSVIAQFGVYQPSQILSASWMGKRNLRHTREKTTWLHNNLEQLWLNCELHRLDVRHQEVLLNRAAYISWESSLKRGCHRERRDTASELLSIVAVDLKVAFLRNWNCLSEVGSKLKVAPVDENGFKTWFTLYLFIYFPRARPLIVDSANPQNGFHRGWVLQAK